MHCVICKEKWAQQNRSSASFVVLESSSYTCVCVTRMRIVLHLHSKYIFFATGVRNELNMQWRTYCTATYFHASLPPQILTQLRNSKLQNKKETFKCNLPRNWNVRSSNMQSTSGWCNLMRFKHGMETLNNAQNELFRAGHSTSHGCFVNA